MVQKDMNILVGVTGGIAAYKTLSLVRLLRERGAAVRVVMSENATRFVTPLSFETVSGQPVSSDPFGSRDNMAHISLRDWADLLVVAPATANFMAKAAAGIADDLLSTTALACRCPRFVCPAMNSAMWDAAPTRRNLDRLIADGWTVIGPESGGLACGEEGPGRMSGPETILEACLQTAPGQKIPGKIVVTAGATRQPLDAVRFLTNRSTGLMGTEIARAAAARFTEVVLVHAGLAVPLPAGVRTVEALTAEAMLEALQAELPGAVALVMAAAVADYTPETVLPGKLKKGEGPLTLTLVRTPDILQETRSLRKGMYTIGFAMESDDLEQNARKKLEAKGLDMIVANPVGLPDAGFGTPTNRVLVLDRDGGREDWGLLSKRDIAARLVDGLVRALAGC